jgi:hypothetical protein
LSYCYVSVIEIVDCTGKASCSFEVRVHGVTPVFISWIKDEEVFNASVSFGSNVTIGKLPLVNFTSTSVIQIVVTDGNHIFKKNLTKGKTVIKLVYSYILMCLFTFKGLHIIQLFHM